MWESKLAPDVAGALARPGRHELDLRTFADHGPFALRTVPRHRHQPTARGQWLWQARQAAYDSRYPRAPRLRRTYLPRRASCSLCGSLALSPRLQRDAERSGESTAIAVIDRMSLAR